MEQHRCTECEESIDVEEWVKHNSSLYDPEIPCEDCGSHPAVECPRCGGYNDAVLGGVPEAIAVTTVDRTVRRLMEEDNSQSTFKERYRKR